VANGGRLPSAVYRQPTKCYFSRVEADFTQRMTVARIRIVKLVLTAVVVLAVTVGTLPAQADDQKRTIPAKTPAIPSLTWVSCDGGFECATAQVPLDYRRPAGGTIPLALIRRQVADPAQRKGTLFLQPGGPGSSGVSFVRNSYAALPVQLRDQFDVFGFDARGVGLSGQLQCWDDAEYSRAVSAALGRPAAATAFDQAVTQATSFNSACRRNAAELLPYVGTAYVARDIDLLRQALGERQVTFYGRSFGSYIGTVYADLFPRRVRAVVLDGGYDPRRYADQPYEYDRTQYLALDAAVERFFTWCANTPQLCTFGSGRPRAAFEQLTRALDADPVPVPGQGLANGYTLAYRLMFNINGGKLAWPGLADALQQAQRRDSSSFLLRPPSPASFDFLTVNVVVECIDRDYPRSRQRLRRELATSTRRAPLLGPSIGYGPPTYDHNHAPACVQWRGSRTSRHHGRYRATGSAPILVIGTTGDPDTPYRDAVALSRRLDNARLLTFRAEGHAAFDRSPCVAAAVTSYLVDLTLPRPDTSCADESQPPSPASQRRTNSQDVQSNGIDENLKPLPAR
jgi:pimeloyl-ACP methyl ester carboxylesterase